MDLDKTVQEIQERNRTLQAVIEAKHNLQQLLDNYFKSPVPVAVFNTHLVTSGWLSKRIEKVNIYSHNETALLKATVETAYRINLEGARLEKFPILYTPNIPKQSEILGAEYVFSAKRLYTDLELNKAIYTYKTLYKLFYGTGEFRKNQSNY